MRTCHLFAYGLAGHAQWLSYPGMARLCPRSPMLRSSQEKPSLIYCAIVTERLRTDRQRPPCNTQHNRLLRTTFNADCVDNWESANAERHVCGKISTRSSQSRHFCCVHPRGFRKKTALKFIPGRFYILRTIYGFVSVTETTHRYVCSVES